MLGHFHGRIQRQDGAGSFSGCLICYCISKHR
jgi:hypothetical protein